MVSTFSRRHMLLSEIFPESEVSVIPLHQSPSGQEIVGYIGSEKVTEAWMIILFFRAYFKTASCQRTISALVGRGWRQSRRQEVLVVFEPTPGLLVLDPAIEDEYPVMIPIDAKESLQEITQSLLGTIDDITDELGVQSQVKNQLIDAKVVGRVLKHIAGDVFELKPHVAVGRTPKMVPVVGVPDPAWEAEQSNAISTAGVLATDPKGNIVVTTALHGTGPVGTSIKVNGHSTTVINDDLILDVAIAKSTDDLADNPRFYKPLQRAVARVESVTYCGVASGRISTVISAVDQAVPSTPPYNQVKIYTPPVLNFKDSGAALINDDGFVAGFAFQRTAASATLQYSSWIWAKSIFNCMQLT